MILSSHLLRDVEECCEEVLVLRTAGSPPTATWRRSAGPTASSWSWSSRGGEDGSFAAAVEALGAEMAVGGKQRIKLVLPEGVEVRDLYGSPPSGRCRSAASTTSRIRWRTSS